MAEETTNHIFQFLEEPTDGGSTSGQTATGGSATGTTSTPSQNTPAVVGTTLQSHFGVQVQVFPPKPVFSAVITSHPVAIATQPVTLNLLSAMTTAFSKQAHTTVQNFYDVGRAGKTLLNFGNDFQALLSFWQYDESDVTGKTLIVKLYEPLPDEVNEKTQVWISRELTPPVIDRLHITHTPPAPPKVYLRPPNRNITLTGRSNATVDNVTLNKLLSAQASDVIAPTDVVVNEWYSDDVNAVELNLNYEDYRDFVFFSSAEARVNAFINKLLIVENLTKVITANSGSLTYSSSLLTPTNRAGYPAVQALVEQRTNLIRTFDPYERFLYYRSGSAYSSSLSSTDVEDDFRFHADATWPKINGVPAPVASASLWITNQTAIAAAYDNANPNYLANNIPAYVKNDSNSTSFTQFVNLVGHQFDTMKVYIDRMTDIHDRSSNPAEGISPDMIWNIAEAFGIELPNQYALANLMSYTIGSGSASPRVYRDLAAETWKRFMHNQIYMMKAKGTKASLRALANTYGILPTTLNIREMGTVGTADPLNSFETIEEQTNVLNIVSGSFIEVPWSLTSSLSASTIEIRFANPDSSRPNVILHADNQWALVAVPLSGSYGKLVLSGSVVAISSSNFPIYSGNFYSTMLRRQNGHVELHVKRAEADSIVETSTTIGSDNTLFNLWHSASYLNVGASSSAFGRPFSGQIDEFRVWTEVTSDDVFEDHVQYPGLFNGNTTTSVRDSLIARLSFNKITNLGSSSVTTILNEAPAKRGQTFKAYKFPNIPTAPYNATVIVREITRYNPTAGEYFTSNKISIAPPPTYVYSGTSNVPVLSHKNSIVSLQMKGAEAKNANFIGFYFSLTDAINDNIIRSLGVLDLQNLLGDPADQYATRYKDLATLNSLYWTYYAYNYNVNTFVDFVENLLEPLFKQAKQLVPARAKLLSGIVHEPHFLERSKHPLKPVEVTAGDKTKNHKKDTHNLEANPSTTQPTVVEGGVPVLNSYTDLADTTHLNAVGDISFNSLITVNHPERINSDLPWYDATIIDIQYDYIKKATLSLFETVNGVGASSPVIPEIRPVSDFNNIESTTYFMDPTGLVGVDSIAYDRLSENVLVDRGVWTTGQTYSYNDYVEQLNQTDGEEGNEYEFRCISPDKTFKSYIPPYLDTKNWVAMAYIPVAIVIPRRAILLSGSVTIAPLSFVTSGGDPVAGFMSSRWYGPRYFGTRYFGTLVVSGSVGVGTGGTAGTAVVGYRPTHYRFTRDNRKGTIRHLHLGCKQDATTTPDGKDPWEVKVSAGTGLFVANGDPIQPDDDAPGPILDVR